MSHCEERLQKQHCCETTVQYITLQVVWGGSFHNTLHTAVRVVLQPKDTGTQSPAPKSRSSIVCRKSPQSLHSATTACISQFSPNNVIPRALPFQCWAYRTLQFDPGFPCVFPWPCPSCSSELASARWPAAPVLFCSDRTAHIHHKRYQFYTADDTSSISFLRGRRCRQAGCHSPLQVPGPTVGCWRRISGSSCHKQIL
jgi:hypothetical protein